jgi:hypothetical protein
MAQFRRQQGGAIVTVASDAAHAAYRHECLRCVKGRVEKPGADRRT